MAPTQNELWEEEKDEALLGNLEFEDEPTQDEEMEDAPVLSGDDR